MGRSAGGPASPAGLRPRLPSAAARGQARSPGLVQTDEASRGRAACRQSTDEVEARAAGAQGSTAAFRVTLFPLLSHQHPAPARIPRDETTGHCNGQAITLQSFQKQSESRREKLFEEQ